jgi:hypothetical protein
MAKEILPFFLLLLVALIGLQVLFSTTAQNKEVFSDYFTLEKGDSTYVVENFQLPGGNTNLHGQLIAPSLSNNWVEADVHLFSKADQKEYMLPMTVQYYSGYEDGESWSEGSYRSTTMANSIPGGDYRMELTLQTDSSAVALLGGESVRVTLTRDTSFGSNFIWALLLISIVPLFLWIRSYSFEKKRWKDAD